MANKKKSKPDHDDAGATGFERDPEMSEATEQRKTLEEGLDTQEQREALDEAHEARVEADAEGGTPVSGRSASELDPRRVEGSDPKLKAAEKSGELGPQPPAATADEPRERKAGDIVWADDLIAALAETGTGHDKLAVIRREKILKFDLGEHYGLPEGDPNHLRKTALPESDPKRHLTAKQALKALEGDPSVGEGTVAKARSIVKTGGWKPADPVAQTPDAHVPPPPKSAPKEEGDEGDEGGEAPKKGHKPHTPAKQSAPAKGAKKK